MEKILAFIKKNINNYPRIKYYLKKIIPISFLKKTSRFAYSKNSNFHSFYINDREIRFHLGALEDTRGIGRVTREQYLYLKKNLSSVLINTKKLKVINFYSSIHWCPNDLPKNSVVMIHDVIPMVLPELFKEPYKDWSKKYFLIAKQASHIITISQTSKNDIIKHLNIKSENITIINNGVTKLELLTKQTNILLPKRYFVYLGSADVHKNLDILLKALALERCSNFHLVMIGDNMQCLTKMKQLNLVDRVHFLGKLDDSDSAFVIKNSIALLFPSLYEGFGLPPMEAALLKIPSICSNRPTMNEFLYDVSLFADPYDADNYSQQMYKMANDNILREKLALMAYSRMLSFTWEKSCANLIKVLSDDKKSS